MANSNALILALICFLFLPYSECAGETPEIIDVGKFSQNDLVGWKEKEFAGKTDYQLKIVDGNTVLLAEAKGSASGLFKKISINIKQYPYLNWQWRVEKPHPPLNEKTKSGDDYTARVYVVVEGGVFFWKTIAINYVWSSSQPAGSTWPNAFAGKNAMLYAVKSPDANISTWYTEKRNVFEDFKNIFGREIDQIDGVAIMSDSDNSGGEVTAYYGDIFFSQD